MSQHHLSLTVNGQLVNREVESRKLLVHFLRDDLGFTGTHVGCDTSQCGACAVRLDGQAAKSCTMLAVQADGAVLETIESFGRSAGLDPVQQAFTEWHGLQCGFCTPGMVIATHELLKHTADPTDGEIRHALHGNICRCTGYQNIVKAVKAAAKAMVTDRSAVVGEAA